MIAEEVKQTKSALLSQETDNDPLEVLQDSTEEEDASTLFLLTNEMAIDLFTKSTHAKQITSFLEDTSPLIEKKFKKLLINRAYSTTRDWFQPEPATPATIQCNFSIVNWNELIRSMVAACFLFPPWQPPALKHKDTEVHVPIYLLNLFEAYSKNEDPNLVPMTTSPSTAAITSPPMTTPATPSIPTAKKAPPKSQPPPRWHTTTTDRSNPDPSRPEATGGQTAILLQMMTQMQAKLTALEFQSSEHTSATSKDDYRPHTPSSEPVVTPTTPDPNEDFHIQLIKTLKIMQGDDSESQPPPEKVTPKHQLEELLTWHDHPMANYKQKASTSAAKALLAL